MVSQSLCGGGDGAVWKDETDEDDEDGDGGKEDDFITGDWDGKLEGLIAFCI
jgi:hypothetical protein